MIVVGLAGIVVPVLPGLLLVWAGVLVWALVAQTTAGWVILSVATVVTAVGSLVKYLLPGKRLRDAGVPWSTFALGAAVGVAGFVLVPVIGLFLGFVLGVYLAERLRLSDHAQAWPSTKAALAAVGWSIAIELVTGLLVAASWAIGVWQA